MYERVTFANLGNKNFKGQGHESMEKSAAEVRKNNKPLLEKKRRARINRSLEQLKNLLIESVKNDQTASGYSKLEKADILEMTVKHLKQLQHEQIKKPSNELSILLRYKAGFNECTREVDRYLSSVESSMNPEIRMRLVSHLTELSRSAPDNLHGNIPPAFQPGFNFSPEMTSRQWTNRSLMGDFPCRTAPSFHLPGKPGTTSTSPLTFRPEATTCDHSDTENFLSSKHNSTRSHATHRLRKRRRLINNSSHDEQNSPQAPLVSSNSSNSLNSSFTISSTTSPFSSPQQEQLQPQSKVLTERNSQPTVDSSKQHQQHHHQSSSTNRLQVTHSPPPHFPNDHPNNSPPPSGRHNKSTTSIVDPSTSTEEVSEEVKVEPVWRPW